MLLNKNYRILIIDADPATLDQVQHKFTSNYEIQEIHFVELDELLKKWIYWINTIPGIIGKLNG